MPLRALLLPTLAAVLVAALALSIRNTAPAASATAPSAGQVHAGAVVVPISNYIYMPKALKVRVGTRVAFHNLDPTAHTATADSGGFDTSSIAQNATRTVRFTKPGTYAYHCAFHAFMKATVTVVH